MGWQKGENSIKYLKKSQQAEPIQQKSNSFLQTGNRKNAFKILTSRAKAAKIAETDFVGVVSFFTGICKNCR